MQWFEDEEFWREFYPVMFPPERLAAGAAEAAQVLALANVASGKVLDLCCGPARHAVPLAQNGFAVTGVDRTRFFLERAQERATAAGVSIEWVHEDMRKFVRPDAFDLACSIFTSFGYFDDEEENRQVIRNVHSSLKPGGALVLETIGKETLARIWKSAICTDLPDGGMVVQRPTPVKDWTRIRNEWTIIREGRVRTFDFEHTIYSGRELKELLAGCGFYEVRLFGSLGGNAFDLDAQRLVAVARKA